MEAIDRIGRRATDDISRKSRDNANASRITYACGNQLQKLVFRPALIFVSFLDSSQVYTSRSQ